MSHSTAPLKHGEGLRFLLVE